MGRRPSSSDSPPAGRRRHAEGRSPLAVDRGVRDVPVARHIAVRVSLACSARGRGGAPRLGRAILSGPVERSVGHGPGGRGRGFAYRQLGPGRVRDCANGRALGGHQAAGRAILRSLLADHAGARRGQALPGRRRARLRTSRAAPQGSGCHDDRSGARLPSPRRADPIPRGAGLGRSSSRGACGEKWSPARGCRVASRSIRRTRDRGPRCFRAAGARGPLVDRSRNPRRHTAARTIRSLPSEPVALAASTLA